MNLTSTDAGFSIDEVLLEELKGIALEKTMTVTTPFLLDNPDKVWLIGSGSVSLYTVQLVNGQETGKRFYFSDFGSHEWLLGFDISSSHFEVAFSVDANEDTLLYEMNFEDFHALFNKSEQWKQAIVDGVENWLEKLFAAIADNEIHPKVLPDFSVKAEDRLILKKGEKISSQRGVLWSKFSIKESDSLRINSISTLKTENTINLLVPLSRKTFFESTRNIGMRFFETKQALEESEAWVGLRVLENSILEIEKAEIDYNNEKERELLQQKYEMQYSKTLEALQQTEAILNKNKVDKYAKRLRLDTENHLYDACQIVGSWNDILFDLPPEEDNLEGESLDPLGDICRASQIRYREIFLRKNWWKQDNGALLGFLKANNHPVALMPTGGGYDAYDPETKDTFNIRNKEEAEMIDALAYTFYKPFPNKVLTLWDIVRFGVFKDYKEVFLLILMGLMATSVGLSVPIFTAVLFDYVVPNADRFQILHIGVALFAAMVGFILFEITENFALLRLETRMESRLQSAVWDRLLDLPPTFFRQFTTGDLAERAMGINEIRKMLSGVVVTSLLGSLFSLLNFGLLFFFSASLAWLAFSIALFQLLVVYWLGRWQIGQEKKVLEYEGKTQGIVLQLLTGIAKFRVTGTEIRAFTHWLNHYNKQKKYAYRAEHIQNIQSTFNGAMPIVANALIFMVLMQNLENNGISTGAFLAFESAFGSFLAAMLGMSTSLMTIFQVMPIYERTKPILETLPETNESKTNPGKLRGDIEINQLDFKYEKDGPFILQDINISLTAGDYVAFVGPSGSGKSTLVRLLLGFEQFDAGNIYYDEHELGKLDLRLVRRQIGVVLQEGELMPGDILSNIIGNSAHLTVEDAWEAAKLAALEEDIKQMPMGMHTIINEGATTLSGGQKQRLLIAKTIVNKPSIIIFDEATSALDNRTQSIVTDSLNKLQATRIVIAHRLSTIKDVDKIFVFDKGRIVQAGSFEELMAVEGLFKELASRQIE
ncbi:MAG: NHLP bacteriocin export ABC transporter permease/ATPase subunit [Cytophagales bacterium]|nr:MAG: NHLP bacteriocin export ABC transporter permease/ATPase subunit [Cytophagales bacterium]